MHELIDRFAPRGRAELVREFTFAFPVQVIARLMGLPREDYVRFQQLSIELLSVVYNWDIGIAASATLKEYFGEILAERRRDPQDDLISTLAESEIDGERLSDDEIFAFLLLILPAGVETTYRASGNLLVAHAHRAVAARDAAADREHAPRCHRGGVALGAADQHGGSAWRGATASSAGSRFRRAPTSASASRPPTGTRRATPTRTASIPTRKNIAHLTFGAGPHVCLGMPLARMETTVAINALLDRLPDLHLDPSAPAPHVMGVAFRSPATLPVEFTPA